MKQSPINKFPFFKQHVDNLHDKAEQLFIMLLKRESNSCSLCRAESPDNELFTVHTLDPLEEPTLYNSVLVCNHCSTRVINVEKENYKQFKLLFGPYLARTATKCINDKLMKENIKALEDN